MEKNFIVVQAFGSSTCKYKTWGSTQSGSPDPYILGGINRLNHCTCHVGLDPWPPVWARHLRGSSFWTSGAGISLAWMRQKSICPLSSNWHLKALLEQQMVGDGRIFLGGDAVKT